MTRRLAIPVALALGLAFAGCGDSDDEPAGPRTLTLRATQTSFQRIFQSKQGFRPGDAFVVSSTITGGGHKEAYCVISSRRRTDWCAVTIVLPRGQLSAEGVFVDAPKLSGEIALLSGSGAYAGSAGTLTTSGVSARRETITLRLRQ